MRRICAAIICAWTLLASPSTAAEGDWPVWRGPNWDGMALGEAPLRWSDTERVAWKVAVPGKGHSSPVVWGDRLFLTTAVPAVGAGGDQGGSLTEHRFMVLAYERKPGRLLWERVARVIVSASREAVGYDLETGKRLWSARGLGQNTIPAPVAAGGLAFVMSGFRDPNLMAIRLFKSSPVGANGKLYLASENEDVIVVKMGPTFEVLATNTLPDQVFIATPAIVDGEVYLRGQNTLFCIR